MDTTVAAASRTPMIAPATTQDSRRRPALG
jgi:hypothetical protein